MPAADPATCRSYACHLCDHADECDSALSRRWDDDEDTDTDDPEKEPTP